VNFINTYYKNNNARIYQCDNLELLKQLPDNYIDLIYCDILYNTGRKFKDFMDNLGTTQEAIEWYKPRLEHIKRVLKDIGSIYLHCDWRLAHYLKVEMDKIFGENNFINEIIWKYKSGGASKKKLSNKHDNIYLYSKYKNKYTYNLLKEKSYNRGFKPYNFKGIEEFKDDIGWYTLINAQDVWEIDMVGRTSKERVNYDTQKPKKLLERIINTSSNKNDIVADFFMGSGTTGETAIQLGRKFIGCDINEKACEITKERITKIISV